MGTGWGLEVFTVCHRDASGNHMKTEPSFKRVNYTSLVLKLWQHKANSITEGHRSPDKSYYTWQIIFLSEIKFV